MPHILGNQCQLHAFVQTVGYITPSARMRGLVFYSDMIAESLECTDNVALLYHSASACQDDVLTFDPNLLGSAFLFHLILSKSVDIFSSSILYSILLLVGNHSIAVVLP